MNMGDARIVHDISLEQQGDHIIVLCNYHRPNGRLARKPLRAVLFYPDPLTREELDGLEAQVPLPFPMWRATQYVADELFSREYDRAHAR